MVLQHPLRRGRILQEPDRRADRARCEAAPAVGARPAERPVHAVGAEGAFVAADAGVWARRRQVAVAAFAVGSEGEHGSSLPHLTRCRAKGKGPPAEAGSPDRKTVGPDGRQDSVAATAAAMAAFLLL